MLNILPIIVKKNYLLFMKLVGKLISGYTLVFIANAVNVVERLVEESTVVLIVLAIVSVTGSNQSR
jgi:hypothetical protein